MGAYNAVLGRFISRDPIAEKGGVNLYEYVGDAPTEFTDPSGKFVFLLAIPLAVAGSEITGGTVVIGGTIIASGILLSHLPSADGWGGIKPENSPNWFQKFGGGMCFAKAFDDWRACRARNLIKRAMNDVAGGCPAGGDPDTAPDPGDSEDCDDKFIQDVANCLRWFGSLGSGHDIPRK